MEENARDLRAIWDEQGQGHVFRDFEKLSPADQLTLLSECRAIDLHELTDVYRSGSSLATLDCASASAVTAELFSPRQFTTDSREMRVLGEAAIKQGRVAVVIVAGGQGTRLGFDRPKGLYPVGPISNKTLFEFLLGKVHHRAVRLGAKPIPVLIMTSQATHQETMEFVQASRSQWNRLDLIPFQQGTMPALDATSGRILLQGLGRLALSPDGHGGMLAALDRSGALSKLRQAGIETLFYCQIDNPLVDPLCPEMIGMHQQAQSEMTTLVIRKQSPAERVGNVAMFGEQMSIVEYSDIDSDNAQRCDDHGDLIFWAGNTGIHLFSLKFLATAARNAMALPFHWARKRVPFLNEAGVIVEPIEPNAIKLERFIFDLMPSAQRTLAIEVLASDYFAPVKNAVGAASDTPETCQAAILAQARLWLELVGTRVSAEARVEIDPSFALDPDDLLQQQSSLATITEGDHWLRNDLAEGCRG